MSTCVSTTDGTERNTNSTSTSRTIDLLFSLQKCIVSPRIRDKVMLSLGLAWSKISTSTKNQLTLYWPERPSGLKTSRVMIVFRHEEWPSNFHNNVDSFQLKIENLPNPIRLLIPKVISQEAKQELGKKIQGSLGQPGGQCPPPPPTIPPFIDRSIHPSDYRSPRIQYFCWNSVFKTLIPKFKSSAFLFCVVVLFSPVVFNLRIVSCIGRKQKSIPREGSFGISVRFIKRKINKNIV